MEEARFYQQNHSIINGRNVWHYMVSTPVSNIHIIKHESILGMETDLLTESNSKAEKKYDQICMAMVKGKL